MEVHQKTFLKPTHKKEIHMKTRTITIRTLIIAFACITLIGCVALALVFDNRAEIKNKPVNVIPLTDEIALIVDKISQYDIDNLMQIIIDDDGNLVENHRELRQRYVLELDRFQFIGRDGVLIDAESSPFAVRLHSGGEGDFEYTFYKIKFEEKTLVVPSEWNVMAFLFLVNEEADTFFACTDSGIYRIDPISQSAFLISSNEYNEISKNNLSQLFYESGGWHLSWIANPVLSSDGQWIAFQSNRSDVNSLPSSRESLWVLNTQTGEERLIPLSDERTQVPQGFLAQHTLLVANVSNRGDAIDYSIVDILNGQSIRLEMGQVPNAHVDDVSKAGYMAIQTYDDAGVRELIVEISPEGACSVIAEIVGNLHYVRFSPDGKQVAAVLREVFEEVIDTILIIDIATGSVDSVSQISYGSYASGLAWVNNRQLIVTESHAVDGKIQENSWLHTLKGE
jgi:hypothetical protein